MAKFDPGVTFTDGDTVTAASLNNIVDTLNIYSGLIADQTAIAGTVSTADLLLLADTDQGSSGAANKVTIQKLLNDALTNGTFTDANISEDLTYGTATGNRTVSTSATITTGTIPNLTAGTTTSTAATITNGTITTGVIPTLTAGTTTSTAGVITTGTIVTLNSTTGTIATINSTTGTIGNLSTTLAGDFTISQGTGTLATSGATAGTYGSVTAIPFLTVNAKGIITSATTGTFSSTPPANSVTFNTLSTSATESDNVANRVAKAWVNFNGTTNVGGNCTIRDDFNVSTVADNGTGNYTVNFSSALSNVNYAVATAVDNGSSVTVINTVEITSQSTTSCTITSQFAGGSTVRTLTDKVIICFEAFGS